MNREHQRRETIVVDELKIYIYVGVSIRQVIFLQNEIEAHRCVGTCPKEHGHHIRLILVRSPHESSGSVLTPHIDVGRRSDSERLEESLHNLMGVDDHGSQGGQNTWGGGVKEQKTTVIS